MRKTFKTNIGFYDLRRKETYSYEGELVDPIKHSHYRLLRDFIEMYSLNNKRCLEIGSGRGLFQDMVHNYTGTDIACSVKENYRKPYVVSDPNGRYPFKNDSFDAIWTITVYEHIGELNEALKEIRRMLKPGGVVLFAPAWGCTPWAAGGYPVRPYSDCGMRGKIIKFSIPIRSSWIWRVIFRIPKRVIRHVIYILGYRYDKIMYRRLRANWDKYWMSDSDACNSIDTHDAILWFESNGFSCLSHPMHFKAFTCHSAQGLVFEKK